MAFNMLGKVNCAHRWSKGQMFPYPRVPVAGDPAGASNGEVVAALVTGTLDIDEDSELQIEACRCFRCGGARLRLYLDEYKWSGWSYLASWAELLLGRQLDECEQRKVWSELVLN